MKNIPKNRVFPLLLLYIISALSLLLPRKFREILRDKQQIWGIAFFTCGRLV
jgi:hypothetical protein